LTTQKDERPFIKVYDSFMKNNTFDSRDHFTYIMIKCLSLRGVGNVSVISTEILLNILGFTVNSKNKNATKDSLQKLVNNKLFRAYKDFNCIFEVEGELKLSETYFFKEVEEEGYFMKLYLDDFRKLLKLDDRSKMKMFTVYYSIISRIYDMESSDKYTLPNIEDIESETGINRKTIPKYTKSLMDGELIYYQTIRKSNDKTKNIYGRWENRHIIREFVENN
jgi:hypothetical protein